MNTKTRADYSREQYDKMRLLPDEFGHRHGVCTVRRSLAEVAQIMGISKQAVHQSERRALAKLRTAMLPFLKELNPDLHGEFLNQQRRTAGQHP